MHIPIEPEKPPRPSTPHPPRPETASAPLNPVHPEHSAVSGNNLGPPGDVGELPAPQQSVPRPSILGISRQVSTEQPKSPEEAPKAQVGSEASPEAPEVRDANERYVGQSALRAANVETGPLLPHLAEVAVLDPVLLEIPETRQLIELGALVGNEVTENFGTPSNPKWASGTHEKNVIMGYHCGGEGGHTSIDRKGAGVPHNVLVIAKAVNDAAGREVYDPLMRAAAVYAGYTHDEHQLRGRMLLPEGQGEGRGDERMSAEEARDRLLVAGASPKVAQQAYDNVVGTAFNPETNTQNVNYAAWEANPDDPSTIEAILGVELTGTADLFGPSTPCGPLDSIKHSVESLCLIRKGQVIQERLSVLGVEPASVTSMEQMLDLIGQDEVMLVAFTKEVAEQSMFFSNLKYSDRVIRATCGKGIDELFPDQRMQNAGTLAHYTQALRAGEHPRVIWQWARALAGYPAP